MKDTLKNSGKRECEHDLMLLALFQKVDQIDPHLRVAFAGGGLFFVFVYVGYHSRNLLSCISTLYYERRTEKNGEKEILQIVSRRNRGLLCKKCEKNGMLFLHDCRVSQMLKYVKAEKSL